MDLAARHLIWAHWSSGSLCRTTARVRPLLVYRSTVRPSALTPGLHRRAAHRPLHLPPRQVRNSSSDAAGQAVLVTRLEVKMYLGIRNSGCFLAGEHTGQSSLP